MAGKIKQVIDRIIEARSQGNETIATTTRTKLILKGINPDKFSSGSEDDPLVLDKLKQIAEEMGLTIHS